MRLLLLVGLLGGLADSEGCVNDDSVGDSEGDTCSSYYDAAAAAGSPDVCGRYDTDRFSASEKCCACGGGSKEAQPSQEDADGATGGAQSQEDADQKRINERRSDSECDDLTTAGGSEWYDSDFQRCDDYVNNSHCQRDVNSDFAKEGNWMKNYETGEKYPGSSTRFMAADEACCGCGGGRSPADLKLAELKNQEEQLERTGGFRCESNTGGDNEYCSEALTEDDCINKTDLDAHSMSNSGECQWRDTNREIAPGTEWMSSAFHDVPGNEPCVTNTDCGNGTFCGLVLCDVDTGRGESTTDCVAATCLPKQDCRADTDSVDGKCPDGTFVYAGSTGIHWGLIMSSVVLFFTMVLCAGCCFWIPCFWKHRTARRKLLENAKTATAVVYGSYDVINYRLHVETNYDDDGYVESQELEETATHHAYTNVLFKAEDEDGNAIEVLQVEREVSDGDYCIERLICGQYCRIWKCAPGIYDQCTEKMQVQVRYAPSAPHMFDFDDTSPLHGEYFCGKSQSPKTMKCIRTRMILFTVFPLVFFLAFSGYALSVDSNLKEGIPEYYGICLPSADGPDCQTESGGWLPSCPDFTCVSEKYDDVKCGSADDQECTWYANGNSMANDPNMSNVGSGFLYGIAGLTAIVLWLGLIGLELLCFGCCIGIQCCMCPQCRQDQVEEMMTTITEVDPNMTLEGLMKKNGLLDTADAIVELDNRVTALEKNQTGQQSEQTADRGPQGGGGAMPMVASDVTSADGGFESQGVKQYS